MIVSAAEDHGVRERSGARGDVDGSAACKIEGTEFEEPAIGIPGPAGDGIVDYGGPDEDEEAGGHETAAFHGTAHHDHGCCTFVRIVTEGDTLRRRVGRG